MRKFAVVLCVSVVLFSGAGVLSAQPVSGAFWVDDIQYRTVLTPANLPDRGPKDGLFVFDGLDGQLPIGEAKPGDKDYNGGRWQVYVVSFTESGMAAHDPNGDGMVDFQLSSWEMVLHHIDLGHLEMAGMGPSFVCPVIK